MRLPYFRYGSVILDYCHMTLQNSGIEIDVKQWSQ